ncbi:hypothetical protein RUMHYD_02409 [Blautia hydrogenotrophica DSM 10507]|uniref:Uncharacterized protein n=1 Tax=Blautia hydrogenotrophica (strain DSM 10507 / JCM 14656 / S5a33) TaxID=476272 RepID=C0CNH0_BLAHS|nr:hypothetical protein RUMHYD_02409 [Blautia hydrogenotrophica DSM 10507]
MILPDMWLNFHKKSVWSVKKDILYFVCRIQNKYSCVKFTMMNYYFFLVLCKFNSKK